MGKVVDTGHRRPRDAEVFVVKLNDPHFRKRIDESKPAHLVVIHHSKKDNFLRAHPQNQAPSQTQSGFIKKGAPQPPQSKAGVRMRTLH